MSQKAERIVVGVDSETPSSVAVDWVIERAEHAPMSVRLVTVQSTPLWAIAPAEARLRAVAERFAAARPGTTVETRIIGPGAGIAEALVAEAADADLLVVGHHQGRILRSALAGALPMQIARRAACPVMIIPEDWLRRFGKTVVGVEWDFQADAAIEFAARESQTFGRSLDIVHVAPDEDHPGDSILVPAPDVAENRTAQLRGAVRTARAGRRGLAVRTFEAQGDPDRILRAHARQAALIVVGSDGAGAVESLLHGSRAYNLMNWSKAPLCVVPSRPQEPAT